MDKTVGIIGYGAYIPRNRIKVEEIAKIWGADAPSYKKGLMLRQKSVPSPDQDTITMSVEATKNALKRCDVDPAEIGAVYIGSESHPYAVKPSGTVVAEAIGATPSIHSADFEFACKAGSEGMFVAHGLVKAGLIKYGLAIGADTSQGAPGDALEYSASAGAAAFIFADHDLLVEIEDTYSYMTDTPDFWRRENQFYPQHGGRFTGEPAYFKHVLGAANGIMEKSKTKPDDFDFVVFHQPNGKFPISVAKKLGFTSQQFEPGLVVTKMGNAYSASSLLGLASVLDQAQPNQKILITSYGSGSGSDSFVLTTTKNIEKNRNTKNCVQNYINQKKYISYTTYRKWRDSETSSE